MQYQNVRTPVSQIPDVGKKDSLYMWHSYRLANAATVGQYPIFNAIKGTAGVNGFTGPLTDRETSLVSNPGQVPLDQRWECWDLGVEYVASSDGPVADADAAELNNQVQVLFIRGATQTIVLGAASLFPGGSGIYGAVEPGNLATVAATGNGYPSIGARRRFQGGRSLLLNPGDTWYMALEVANSDGLPLTLAADWVDVRVSFWMYRDLGISG